MQPKTEQEKFLEENQEASPDIFEQDLTPAKEEEPKVEEVDGEKLRNRRERRLAEKLQAEREAGIAMAARLQALTENKTQNSPLSSFEEKARKIYGNEAPENAQATELLLESMRDLKETAKKEALEALREEQRKEREEHANAEKELNSILEEIEDENNVEITPTVRTAYLKLLEKMSPKDSEGNIIQYADHHAVWDMFQSQIKKPENRAKDLSARTMTQSGASKESTLQNDATTRYLIEQGFI